MTMSDLNIAVLRHGLSKINELKQLLSIADQLGVGIDGFIYNAYEKPSSYYGYYGLYGNYAYQYYAKKYLYESYEYDKKIKAFISISLSIMLSSCSLSPGMHMDVQKNRSTGNNEVFIESIGRTIPIIEVTADSIANLATSSIYRIGNGDEIVITVWGIPDIFPITSISPDQNRRRVDSNGNIYFPFVGLVKAAGKTQNELRSELALKLSSSFNEPQLDLSIAKFNSKKIYLLGEVTQPEKINLTDVPITLADAIGEVKGLSTVTANGADVFIIRSEVPDSGDPIIFRANLSSPAGFLAAGNFYLSDNDIVYVNAKGTTRWNRVISQFFPFSTFLNSIDNLTRN